MQMQKMAPERSPLVEGTGKKVRVAVYLQHQLLADFTEDAQPAAPQPPRKRGRSPEDEGDDERLVSDQPKPFSTLLTVNVGTSSTEWKQRRSVVIFTCLHTVIPCDWLFSTAL